MKKLEDSIYGFNENVKDIPTENYISVSKLKTFSDSSYKFLKKYLLKEVISETSPAMEKGKLIHEAILEPEKAKKNFVIAPKFEGEGSRKAKKEWVESLPKEAVIVEPDFLKDLNGILKEVQKNKTTNMLLSKGIKEPCGLAWNEELKINMMLRPDMVTPDGIIIDLKKSSNGNFKSFSRDFFTYGYYIQAPFYFDGIKLLYDQGIYPIEPKAFVFVVVEDKPPYDCFVYAVDEGSMDAGRKAYKRLAKDIVEAMDSFEKDKDESIFRKKNEEIQNLSLPTWAFYQVDELY